MCLKMWNMGPLFYNKNNIVLNQSFDKTSASWIMNVTFLQHYNLAVQCSVIGWSSTQ
jgi:hypothetical protein